MRKFLLPILALTAAVWFLYFQTGGFEFLRLDDHDYTFRCAFVRDGLSWANVAEAFANPRHAAIWMPVTYISYMADITLFGPGMGPHHLVNVLIHSLNAGLLYLLILVIGSSGRFDGRAAIRVPAALLAAAFWAIHPQRAEAVAWIAGRKELLCALFTLLGLLCWTRQGLWRTLGATCCCALACMSKPTAMCFPFLALAVDLLTRERGLRPLLARARPYIPLLILAVATGALAVYSQTHPEGHPELALFSASFPWRLLNAAVAVGLYLFQALVPVGIHLDYRAVPGEFPLHGVLGLTVLVLGLLAVGAAMFRTRADQKRRINAPTLATLLLFFLAALAPTLGVFGSFGEHARADRFLYLPACALSILLALVATDVADWWEARMTRLSPMLRTGSIRLAGALFLLVFICAAVPVVAAYQNDFTAFSRTLLFDPENGRALAHVASEECARFGHIDKGITLYRQSQSLRPRDDTAAQLAYTLALRGLSSDYAEIRRLCAKFACDHSLDHKGMALEALGTTAMRQRKWQEAISCLADSVKAPLRFYSAEDALLRLGACYCNAKRPEDAIRIFEPLTQSRRTDIAGRARQFLGMIKKNPKTILLF
ncbi:MAG: hypothetical protein ACI4RA_08040 [Kiritimatiellia bacterium]